MTAIRTRRRIGLSRCDISTCNSLSLEFSRSRVLAKMWRTRSQLQTCPFHALVLAKRTGGSGLFGSKRSESRNGLSRRFSCVRLARHPKPIFTRLAAFEDRPSKRHRASNTAILINKPNPTEAQRNRRFFNSLPFARTGFNGPPKSFEQHELPLLLPHA